MLQAKIDQFKLHLWYYKKSAKKQLFFFDIFLLSLVTFTIVKGLNPVNLIFVYIILNMMNVENMVSFSNSALACTPLNLKDTISITNLITWGKATIIILVSLFLSIGHSLFTAAQFNYTVNLINVFKYAVADYAMLKFLSVVLCYVANKYRSFAQYIIITIFIAAFFYLEKTPTIHSLVLFIALSLVVLLITQVLIKRLDYETIFFKEAER